MNDLHQDYEIDSEFGKFGRLCVENEQLKARITELEAIVRAYQAEHDKEGQKVDNIQSNIEDHKRHRTNERGAGRKKDNAEMQKERETYIVLQNSGADMITIMDKMSISRSTYYRLKRYAEMILKK